MKVIFEHVYNGKKGKGFYSMLTFYIFFDEDMVFVNKCMEYFMPHANKMHHHGNTQCTWEFLRYNFLNRAFIFVSSTGYSF